MEKNDRMSSLFFIGIALAIFVESYRLDIGSLSAPGPGLFPLGSGLVLGILGAILFAKTFGASEEDTRGAWDFKPKKKMILMLVSLVAYMIFINLVGFIVVTILWMGYVCWGIGKMRWRAAMFTSIVTSLVSYFLFEYFLGIRFPQGIFSP